MSSSATTTSGSGTFGNWAFGIAGTPGAGAVNSVNGQIGNVSVPVTDALDVARIDGTDLLAIVDANNNVLLNFRQDGSAVLPGVKAPSAEFGALAIAGTTTEEVWGIGFAVAHANDRVAFYILDDGTVPFSMRDSYIIDGVNAASLPDNDAASFNIHLNTGQSLAVTGTDGAIPDATDKQLAAGGSALVPLTNAGSYGLGLCTTVQLKYALTGDAGLARLPSPAFRSDHVQVFQTNVFSGVTIAQISPGATPDRYAENITAVQNVANIAIAAGKAAQVAFLTLFHGESDFNNAAYKQAMKDLKNAYNAQILPITQQPNRFPMLTYQLAGSNNAGIPVAGKAQWEAWREDPEILLAGPLYPYKYVDALHPNSAGIKWFGQQAGKVAYLATYLGRSWKPLHPLSVKVRAGNVLTVKLHVPAPPIVLDTTTVPAAPNYGFRVFDATGELTVSNVQVVNADTISMTIDRALAASPMLEYAWRDDPVNGGAGNYDGLGTHAIRGNIRDSDASVAVYGSSFPLWNWLVRFELPITG